VLLTIERSDSGEASELTVEHILSSIMAALFPLKKTSWELGSV